jgi:SAM-dependent methyltransferase
MSQFMTRFELGPIVAKSNIVEKSSFIVEKCKDKDVLDLGCVQHTAEHALSNKSWLHRHILKVARSVVGVDYLESEVAHLKKQGFNVICADVTKPILIDKQFDVIVAGDLIEHLTNFDGFFDNCRRLLKPGGIVIISTPNPYYHANLYFLALRRHYFINPEHTCWIDPQCLSQLAARYNLKIASVDFIGQRWSLGKYLCDSKKHPYDFFTGHWSNKTVGFKILRRILSFVVPILYFPAQILTGVAFAKQVRHSDYIAVLRI